MSFITMSPSLKSGSITYPIYKIFKKYPRFSEISQDYMWPKPFFVPTVSRPSYVTILPGALRKEKADVEQPRNKQRKLCVLFFPYKVTKTHTFLLSIFLMCTITINCFSFRIPVFICPGTNSPDSQPAGII